MKREVRELRKAIWRNMQGCNCEVTIVRNGKTVAAPKDDVCSPEVVRCNGRNNRIIDDFEKHGLKVGPVGPGESGLALPSDAGAGKGE